ncbi:MAG: trypsin-like peptidase domain-containing protein [Verrucomicrobia bacterium]|nr:trypsin-like peptidase domain-containing protein [Verrucomicrobiota bacterium]
MAKNEIFAQVRRATVGLVLFHPNIPQKPYTIVGSGFCVDPNGVVVTCQHIVSAFMEKSVPDHMAEFDPAERKSKLHHEDNVKIQIPFVVFLIPGDVPHQIKALLCRVDQIMARTDCDLALVRVLPHTALPNGYPFLEIEPYDDISEGDEIATYGYPLGNFLFEQIGTITSSFTRGSISSIVPSQGILREHLRMFQLNLTATYGNSGGPVFAVRTGRAFGVLQGGIVDRQGTILPGLSRAEPVYPVVNSKDVGLIKFAPPGQLPSPEQIKKAWGVPN